MDTMDFWRSENGVYGRVAAQEEAERDARWRNLGGGRTVGVSDSMCSGRGPTRKRYTASPKYLWHIRTSSDIFTHLSEARLRNAQTAIRNNCFWKCELASLLTTPSFLSSSSSQRPMRSGRRNRTFDRVRGIYREVEENGEIPLLYWDFDENQNTLHSCVF